MEPYDPEFVATLLKQLKATDVCVIDISEKVDWVKYMVYATGRASQDFIVFSFLSPHFFIQVARKRISNRWRILC